MPSSLAVIVWVYVAVSEYALIVMFAPAGTSAFQEVNQMSLDAAESAVA